MSSTFKIIWFKSFLLLLRGTFVVCSLVAVSLTVVLFTSHSVGLCFFTSNILDWHSIWKVQLLCVHSVSTSLRAVSTFFSFILHSLALLLVFLPVAALALHATVLGSFASRTPFKLLVGWLYFMAWGAEGGGGGRAGGTFLTPLEFICLSFFLPWWTHARDWWPFNKLHAISLSLFDIFNALVFS